MALIVRNFKIDWTWTGDDSSLRGFSVVIAKSDDYSVIVASQEMAPTDRTCTLMGVTVDPAVQYIAGVQAHYVGKDSDWVSSTGLTVPDDGTAHISNDSITESNLVGTGKVWTSAPESGATVGATWGDNIANQPTSLADLDPTVAAEITSLKTQTDNKLAIFVQSNTPSWTDANANHVGDSWYKTTDMKWYKYNGTSWVVQDSSIYNLNDLASSKTTIHYASGTSSPSIVLGRVGDFCLYKNTSTGVMTYYKKTGTTTWTAQPGSYVDGADVTADVLPDIPLSGFSTAIQTAVNDATAYIANIANDGIITVAEKKSIVPAWESVVNDYTVTASTATGLGISTTAFDAAATAVHNEMKLVFGTDVGGNIDYHLLGSDYSLTSGGKTRTYFTGLWNAYYAQWATLKKAIEEKAATTADWSLLDGMPVNLTSFTENDTTKVMYPKGGAYSTSTSPIPGAIKITLPQGWTATMMQFEVDVFNYSDSRSFKLILSGYTYNLGTGSWNRTSVNLLGSTLADNRVRFGYDTALGKCCILIGNTATDGTASVWSLPKVTVSNFQAGHGDYYGKQYWETGWNIGIVNSTDGMVFTADYADALIDAASIKGQGALALKDTADYATYITGGPPTDADNTATRLATAGALTLKGTLTPQDSGALKVGSITWNTTTGALTGGSGIAITEAGIIGAKSGEATFSIDALGNAQFKGDITGSTITGSTLKTSTTARRLELSNSTNDLKVYNTAGAIIAKLGDAAITTVDSAVLAVDVGSTTATTYRGVSIKNAYRGLYISNCFYAIDAISTGDRCANFKLNTNSEFSSAAVEIDSVNTHATGQAHGLRVSWADNVGVVAYGGTYGGQFEGYSGGIYGAVQGSLVAGEWGVTGNYFNAATLPSEITSTWLGGVAGYSGNTSIGVGVCGIGGKYGVAASGVTAAIYATGGTYGVSSSGTSYCFYARSGTATGLTGSYGPFTGSHDGVLALTDTPVPGDILVDIAILNRGTVSDVLGLNTLSSAPKQKSVFGVFVARRFPKINTTTLNEETGEEIVIEGDVSMLIDMLTAATTYDEFMAVIVKSDLPTALLERKQDPLEDSTFGPVRDYLVAMLQTHNLAVINSVGEGMVNVCSEGGNIEAGDYICSSSIPGKGMKQDDDLLHNYTVAKARETVAWAEGDDSIKMIACTYHCG